MPCIRLMAAIACELRLDLCRFDVQQAFVQADLKKIFFDVDATGLRSTVRESSTLESEPARLETRQKSHSFELSLADACVFPIDRGRVCSHHCCGTR